LTHNIRSERFAQEVYGRLSEPELALPDRRVDAEIRKRELLYTEFIAECSKLAIDALTMQITEITGITVHPTNDGLVRAYVNIVLDNCFMVREIRVIRGPTGLFVSMPAKKQRDGTPGSFLSGQR
jgi:hypothetical protein